MSPEFIAFHVIKSTVGLSAADLYFDIAFGTDIGPEPKKHHYDQVHRVLNDMLESLALTGPAREEIAIHLAKLEERMEGVSK
jgi:hypothetical protein